MNFEQTLTLWEKAELTQGKIMIGVGILLLIAVVAIFRSQNPLLCGGLIPLSLLLAVLIGYGGYLLKSRPEHVRQSVALYQTDSAQAIEKEIIKHTNDNKAGNMLMEIYPLLAIVALLALYWVAAPFYKGLALGFALLFIATYVIDNGFVTRSDKVLAEISGQ